MRPRRRPRGSAAGPGLEPGRHARTAVPRGPAPISFFSWHLINYAGVVRARRGLASTTCSGSTPTADVAPDAHFYLAETYAQEGNMAVADSGYQDVRGPVSDIGPIAATALYKHAGVLAAAGKTASGTGRVSGRDPKVSALGRGGARERPAAGAEIGLRARSDRPAEAVALPPAGPRAAPRARHPGPPLVAVRAT